MEPGGDSLSERGSILTFTVTLAAVAPSVISAGSGLVPSITEQAPAVLGHTFTLRLAVSTITEPSMSGGARPVQITSRYHSLMFMEVGGGYPAFGTSDSATWGQLVGHVGGGTYSQYMGDNPFYGDH